MCSGVSIGRIGLVVVNNDNEPNLAVVRMVHDPLDATGM